MPQKKSKRNSKPKAKAAKVKKPSKASKAPAKKKQGKPQEKAAEKQAEKPEVRQAEAPASPEKPSEAPEKKKEFTLNVSLGSMIVVFFIVIFGTATVYLIFHTPSQPTNTDYVIVNKFQFRFRSELISDCLKVPIDEEIVSELSRGSRAIILFDPYGEQEYGLTAYELIRITSFSRIPTTYAYSQEGDYEVETLSSSQGTISVPIISLEMGNTTEVVRVAPGQYIVRGADQSGLDDAACQLGLELFKELYGLKLKT
ncbi:hypothetical protein ACFLQI_01200 [Candidatus Undinarchaeota archaeon]